MAEQPISPTLKIAQYLLKNYPLPRGRGSLERLLTKLSKWPESATFDFRFGRFVDVSLAPWPFGYRTLFLHGVMEEDYTHLLLKLLQPGDRFIDGGANQGYYSFVAAKAVGPKGRVYSFEPIPTTAAHLRRHIEASKVDWIEVTQAGLSDQPGELKLYVFEEDPIGGQSSAVSRTGLGKQEALTCPICVLDEFIEKTGSKIAMIKLDVEGCELPALQGAERTLASQDAPAVWFEYNEGSAQGMGYHAVDVVAFLRERGYSAYLSSLIKGQVKLSPFEVNREIPEWTPMVFCVKPGFMWERAERAGILPAR